MFRRDIPTRGYPPTRSRIRFEEYVGNEVWGGKEEGMVKRRESVSSRLRVAEYPQSGNWSLKCEETRESRLVRGTTEAA